MTKNTVIVTRHAGMVQWLKNHGIVGDVISHVENVEQIAGKNVYGILPLHLAIECNCITTVDMDIPAEKRGMDISPEEMDEYGATMRTYIVLRG
jgi:putative CRISPR-associated protein (TIGR02620 family)